MQRNDLAVIAKGLVPFVRECVAEATTISPQIAEQVALAVRMLHEAPPIEQRSEPHRSPPKVTRIERDDDGNFVPVYDDHAL